MRKQSALVIFVLSAAFTLRAQQEKRVFDIRAFGAESGGKTLCTRAIQQAVDACEAAGGGVVYLPSGRWLTGTISLKSKVTLWFDQGCVLLGSPRLEDYPVKMPSVRSFTDNYVRQTLIRGEGLEHIAIRGQGTIDGNGGAFFGKKFKVRPYLIRFIRCTDVLVEGVHLRNSAMWMQHYLACDRVRIRGITVWNHVNYNNDGLDIDGCHDVIVSGCSISSGDDALCLKSTLNRSCRNIVITNCVLSSHCNAIKMGTETTGGFQNVTITNCAIFSPPFTEKIIGRKRGLAGIALEIVDGGILNRIAISNIVIRGVTTPIFLRLGNRARPYTRGAPKPGVGSFRNVTISNVVATGSSTIGCSITGLPGHFVENVTLRDITVGFEGGGKAELAGREIPEKPRSYPECTMFGPLPAYGFYCRHVRGLRFYNLTLQTETPDLRHALVFEDVEDLLIDGLKAPFAQGARALIRMTQTRGALIRGSSAPDGADPFLSLTGEKTERIVLTGNDLRRARRTVELGSNVPQDALTRLANIPPAGAGPF